jgi:hypothetical protein
MPALFQFLRDCEKSIRSGGKFGLKCHSNTVVRREQRPGNNLLVQARLAVVREWRPCYNL